MARIRTIKPAFFRHERLFEAERESGLPLRVAFAGLWTACDKAGRFEWRPRSLKLDCLPYDEVDFERVLDALTTRGFVVKYAISGREYGCIPSWSEHQVPNNKEKESEIPAAPETPSPPIGSTRDERVNDAKATPLGKDRVEREGEQEGEGSSVANATGAVAPQPETDLGLPAFLDKAADLKTKLFGPCLDWLAGQSGKSTVALRSMVGKWLSDWGEGAVLEAFVAAQKESPVDPVAWIRRSLETRNDKRTGNRKPTAGQTARAGIADALLTDA
jgi:hypothetical protein